MIERSSQQTHTYLLTISKFEKVLIKITCKRRAPIRSLVGQESDVLVYGTETFCARLFAGNIIGRTCCPISKSHLTLSLDLGKYKLLSEDTQIGNNFNKEPKIMQTTALLSKIQVVIEKMQRS